MDNKILNKNIKYENEITHIIHISDIHIPLYKRHKEYLELFETLYLQIKKIKSNLKIAESENDNIPIIIVITGDLLHSKTDLSPECIQITYNFLKKLSKILPVVLIPGNHDVNMNNKERLDSITAIIADLTEHYPIYYLLHSGIYTMNNIVFYHASIFDYNIIPANELKYEKHQTKIALFHGRINGVELYNGIKLSGETNSSSNKTITSSAFDNYDLVLLGDIHRHQFVKPNIAYAGSLIQQNIGEELLNHGLILWDVKNKTGSFQRIKNNYGYLQVHIENNKVDETLMVKKDELNTNIPKNIRMRILYKNTTLGCINDFITIAKINHNILEVNHQNNDDVITDSNSNDRNNLNINLTQPEEQNKYIEAYLKDATTATDADIEAIKQINVKLNSTINIEKTVNVYNFKLKSLKFSNFFSYGTDNSIYFKNLRGIVGIIADNHMGKSSILEILLFVIYDKFSRKGGVKDMINNRKKNFLVHVVLDIEDYEYHIVKSGTRNKSGGITQKIKFYKIKGNINENLEEDTIAKTKNTIQNYFGNYNDIINTNFSIQNNSNTFIDSENTSRKKELERILNIEFIESLYKNATQIHTKNNNIYEHLSKKINPEQGVELVKAKNETIASLDNISSIRTECNQLLKQKREDLINLHKKINSSDDNLFLDLDELNYEYKKIQQKHTDILLKYNELNKTTTIENDDQNLTLTELQLKLNNKIDTINTSIIKYDSKLSKYNDIKLNINKNINPINEENYEIQINNLTTLIEKTQLLLTNNNNKTVQLPTIETNITQVESEIESINDEYNSIQKQSLPDSLLNVLNTNSQSNLKKHFLETEKTLFDKLKTNDDIVYKNFTEYKNYSKSSKTYYFDKELKTYNKNTGKTENKLIIKRNEAINKLKTLKLESKNLNAIMIETTTLNKDLENYKKEMSRLKKIRQEQETIIIKNEELESELVKVQESLTKYTKLKQQQTTKLSNVNNHYNTLIQLESTKKQMNELNNEMKIIKKNIEIYNKNKDRIDNNKKINLDIKQTEKDIELLEQKYNEIDIEFNKLQINLSKTLLSIKQYKSDNQEKKEIDKKRQLNLWYKDSLKQLPFYIISKIVPIIEKKVNDLLSVITDFHILFQINDGKIDIYLNRTVYNDIPILINNASGFEKFISSVAIRLAILSVSNLPKINFIAIDEGWSCLDNHNVHNIKTILEYISHKFDFVLTISHLTEIKQHCDHQILLKKDENSYSCVNYN
jgi:DNA repair exonuclease SbcCD ATPase subunit/predicted MPP superfamily phosphohydrolase